MIQRSISLPVKPQEENQSNLERSEEIEELCEEFENDQDNNDIIFFKYDNRNNYNHHDNNCNCNKNFDSSENEFYENVENETNIRGISKNVSRQQNSTKSLTEKSKSESCLNDDKNIFVRVIDKSGRRNVNLLKIPKRSLRYCKDFVTTLIEQRWRYTLTVFVGSFISSWIIFTLLWYLIAYAHGDLLFDENGNRLGEGTEPCIIGAKSLLGIFIYTVETQITIGFGEKYPSEHCPESVFLFVVQIIVSVALEGAMIGIIYSKMSRPVKYVAEYKFSKKAVICTRDGKLCFIFRVCDPGEHQAIDTKISAFVLMDTMTAEGEFLMKTRKELTLSNGTSPIITWPETVCHVINKTSPLFEFIDIENKQFIKHFEIYISLVGSSPSMGQITESKTSYLPCEIVWNHYFENIVMYDWEKDNYHIDYNNFNTLIHMKI